jgi:hypothetical protein
MTPESVTRPSFNSYLDIARLVGSGQANIDSPNIEYVSAPPVFSGRGPCITQPQDFPAGVELESVVSWPSKK